jgi:hypothetical protein
MIAPATELCGTDRVVGTAFNEWLRRQEKSASWETVRITLALVILALVLIRPTPVGAGELCSSKAFDQFKRDAFQYPKKQQEQIIKAATDLELQLRGKLKPPYMVCAGMAVNLLDPQVEVCTLWQGQDCADRFKVIPHRFEGQPVAVYCKNGGKLL